MGADHPGRGAGPDRRSLAPRRAAIRVQCARVYAVLSVYHCNWRLQWLHSAAGPMLGLEFIPKTRRCSRRCGHVAPSGRCRGRARSRHAETTSPPWARPSSNVRHARSGRRCAPKQALDPKLAADLWTLKGKLCAEFAPRAAYALLTIGAGTGIRVRVAKSRGADFACSASSVQFESRAARPRA